jgi:asparagine synthase (glutamine-hydrolysing)
VESDERGFARLVARHFNFEFVEQPTIPDGDLGALLKAPRFERPMRFMVREESERIRSCAKRYSATATLWGHGGDELFCRHHTRYYVSDFIAQQGFRRGFLEVALNAAVKDRISFWSVMGKSLFDAYLPHRFDLLAEQRREQEKPFLVKSTWSRIAADPSFDLPYGQSTRTSPPGRLFQMLLVNQHRPYYPPFEVQDDPSQISPLLSQPLVEACLRIPTYFQTLGRTDRAIARRAFVTELPSTVLTRRSKGGVEDYAAEIQRRNLPFARRLLTDGLLVRNGVIDGPAIASAVSGNPSNAAAGITPVLSLLATESWLRLWLDPDFRQPDHCPGMLY